MTPYDPFSVPEPSTASIRFELDGFGQMRKTLLLGKTDTETITVTASYDELGSQTSLNDPDKGLWTYTNDALGRVTYQKDAKSTETVTTYDRLNRVLSRQTKEANDGPVELAQWYYFETSVTGRPNTVLKGDQGWIGALQRTESQTTGLTGLYGDPGTKTVHYYDSRGNPFLDLTTIDGKWFYTQKSFDPANRLREVRHYWRPPEAESPTNLPYVWSDFGYSYTYDSNSYLTQLSDLAGNVWWKAVGNGAYDEQDRPVLVQKGSAYGTKRDYRASDGALLAITTGKLSGNTPGAEIQNLSFGWDGLGNLAWRQSGSLREDFGYDELNRLASSTLTGAISYFVDGGFKNKKDVNGATTADYTYDPVHPHAVRTAFGYTMTYDANGNLDTRVSPTKTETWKTVWAGFDKPRILSKTTTTPSATSGSEFYYNANRSRVIHLDYDAADANGRSTRYTLKRLYAYGASMEVDYRNGNRDLSSPAWKLDKVRIYVPGPEGTVGAMEYNAGSPSAAEKLVYHYDQLGSIESVTAFGDTNAAVVPDKEGRPSKYSYDAWGQRRDGIDWIKSPAKTATGGGSDVTPRGYTGHEMLDNLGLVHMNGRIYDPLLGRFLSADIVVQAPGSLQSYNRYSYVLNNPLTLVDPTGWYFQEMMPNWAWGLTNAATFGLATVVDHGVDTGIEAKAVYTTVRSNDSAATAGVTAAGVAITRFTGAMDWAEAVHGEKIVVSNGQASTTEITSPTEVAVKAVGGAAGMTLTGVGGAKGVTALSSSEGSATAAAQTTTQEARAVAGTSAADSRMAQGAPKTRATPELKTSSPEGTKPAATEKLSKVEKSKTVEQIGDSRFTRTTEVRPGNGPGQTRAEYVRIKDEKGNVIKTYKDTFDRANKFQHRKPLRGGPEGRPQNE